MQERSARQNLKEQGFASIVIAIVLILVLSLITIGFADLMRREQKSALNKHLSNQAYYAAESGINDAAKAINAGYAAAKQKCDTSDVQTTQPGSQYLMHPDVGTDDSVANSCLLINPQPNTLEFGSISDTEAKVVEVSGVDGSGRGTPIDSLVISWQESNPSGASTFANEPANTRPFYTNNPADTDHWKATVGVLRVGITPFTNNTNSISRDTLSSLTTVSFLYPNAGTTASTSLANYSTTPLLFGAPSQSGTVSYGNCTNNSRPLKCNVRLAGLTEANNLLDMRSMYRLNHVVVAAYDNNGNQLFIRNGQTVVDSTGRAQDVLRRVQVRIPSKNNYDVPPFALSVIGGICKQLELYPTSGTNKCTP